jgi:AraC family transcriptional regulator, transcriptional activator of pobA
MTIQESRRMAQPSHDEQQEPLAKRLPGGLAATRPRDLAPSGVLVALRTVFHVNISQGRFGQSWSPRLVMAKWVLSGSAAMEVGGRRLTFGPGQVAIYLPTIPHRFWAEEAVNEFSWFTVDGPGSEELVLEMGLRPGVYTAPPPTPERLQEMADALRDQSLPGRRAASLLAIREWYRLANDIREPAPLALVAQVRHLIAQEFSDPGLSIAAIAKRLGYHRASLSRLFHQQAGQTIIDHLAEVRLREARALLAHTEERIAEVARQCGFSQAAYFCRWFRKQVGTSPGVFREQA